MHNVSLLHWNCRFSYFFFRWHDKLLRAAFASNPPLDGEGFEGLFLDGVEDDNATNI
jgi:hypothetical protein